MFNDDGVARLVEGHADTLRMVDDLARSLKARFHNMDDAIECLMIAAMSGESMVLIGPPGTAKSRLIRAFCHQLGLIETMAGDPAEGDDRRYFEYLLTQFTEPSELFGFYDLALLSGAKPRLERQSRNMMQTAEVVFLDEVFNASSAILNALLTFMNERRFHDRGVSEPTRLELLVAATNHPPRDPALQAVYDRFLLRCWMPNVASRAVRRTEIATLLEAGWTETHATRDDRNPEWRDLLVRLQALRHGVDEMTASKALAIDPASPLFGPLTEIVSAMVGGELSAMSNRRLVKMAGLALSLRLLRAARGDDDGARMRMRDLDVFTRFSADRHDDAAQAVLHKLAQRLEDAE